MSETQPEYLTLDDVRRMLAAYLATEGARRESWDATAAAAHVASRSCRLMRSGFGARLAAFAEGESLDTDEMLEVATALGLREVRRFVRVK